MGTVRPAVVRALAAGTQQSSHPTLTMLRKEASLDSLEEGNEAKQTETRLISSGMKIPFTVVGDVVTNREVAQTARITKYCMENEYFSMQNRPIMLIVKLLKIIFVCV